MITNSSMTIGEIGNQMACNGDQEGLGSYVSIYINMTYIPTFIRMGMCLPAGCT